MIFFTYKLKIKILLVPIPYPQRGQTRTVESVCSWAFLGEGEGEDIILN